MGDCVTDILIDFSQPVPSERDEKKRNILKFDLDDDSFTSPISPTGVLFDERNVLISLSPTSPDLNNSLEIQRCASRTGYDTSQNWTQKFGIQDEMIKDDLSNAKDIDIVQMINDEEFDFDLPVSPENSTEKNDTERNGLGLEDDEVFFGPIKYIEKCVAVAVEEEAKVAEKFKPLSPLTATEMAELCKEAFTVACRIELSHPKSAEKEKKSTVDTISPALTFSPLDDIFQSLSKALPSIEKLPSDANGVIKFEGKKENVINKQIPATQVNPFASESVKTKPPLRQPASSRMSGVLPRKLNLKKSPQSTRSPPKSTSLKTSPVLVDKNYVKRQRTSSNDSDMRDDTSIASDCSESSIITLASKRQLPVPRIKPSMTSRLPQFGSSAMPMLGGNRPTSSESTESTLLAQSGACRMESVLSVTEAENKTNMSSATKSAIKEPVSRLETIQRKTLIASRSSQLTGPLKAVGLVNSIFKNPAGSEDSVAKSKNEVGSCKLKPSTPSKNKMNTESSDATNGGSHMRSKLPTASNSQSSNAGKSFLPTPSKLNKSLTMLPSVGLPSSLKSSCTNATEVQPQPVRGIPTPTVKRSTSAKSAQVPAIKFSLN